MLIKYVYGSDGQLLAQRSISSNKITHVHPDQLGTPQAMSDGSGRRVWTTEYDPFGQATVNEDPDGDGKTSTLNLRFPGQYFDSETGLHYNYFRDYDPALGRYIQSDPIGLRGGINTYAYVAGNPIRYIDPLGLVCVTCTAIDPGGSGYKDDVKQCRYNCSSDDGRQSYVDGPGQDLSGGDVCYGANYHDQYIPSTGDFTNMTDSLGPFDVDTDSFLDNLTYPDELIDNIESTFPDTNNGRQ